MLKYSSVAVLARFVNYAKQLQINPEAALIAANICPSVLQDNSQRLPTIALEQVLLELAAQSQDPLFGLHAAHSIQPASWSILGYITMNCATLGQAIERIIPYEALVGDSGYSEIIQHQDRLELIWHCRHQSAMASRHLAENVLAAWLSYAQHLTGTQHAPLQVNFIHAAASQLAAYHAVFNCPLNFNQPYNSLVIPLAYLDLPLQQADAHLLNTLEQHASQLLIANALKQNCISQQVQSYLQTHLAQESINKQQVAEHLQLSVRTLDRRLQKAGTSFQQLLDQTRIQQAEHLLLHSDLTLLEIADALGFSESRSFFRHFKKHTHTTPLAFRQQYQ
ncbi:AraC family transcriptional regulator [Thiopseudomonas alkaliphila]|uniref:AraC family transcriptional regulator n=1 Tax=Thiopseudomonas alkaliphila TaxID=1697053 RepID=UPI00069D4342|nr:AraC family transcriptional regulator [Thiopseudomonas alkaliphila]AKX50556.1 hypothetical protein AKN92_02890 [Thiopseudomonas alkaliphila]AKX56894.1 hypothetical protein AKN89_02885 [Thiopseudomonas alkaliphila]